MSAGRFSTYNFIKAEKGFIHKSEISMETYYFNVEFRLINPFLNGKLCNLAQKSMLNT